MVGILNSLLPGLRELRASLVAGLLWSACLYVWLAEELTTISETEVVERIHELAAYVGTGGLFVVLALLSYIVGSLSVSATERLVGAIGILSERVADEEQTFFIRESDLVGAKGRRVASIRRSVLAQFLPIRQNGVSRVYSRLSRFIDDWGVEGMPPEFLSMAAHPSTEVRDEGPEPFGVWLFERSVFHDVIKGDISSRLLTKAEYQSVYQEYDRHRSEAELRLAICLPGTALSATLAAEGTFTAVAFALSTMLLLFAVLGQALSRRAQAGDVLAVAVGDDLISTPTLDRAMWWTERNSHSLSTAENRTHDKR